MNHVPAARPCLLLLLQITRHCCWVQVFAHTPLLYQGHVRVFMIWALRGPCILLHAFARTSRIFHVSPLLCWSRHMQAASLSEPCESVHDSGSEGALYSPSTPICKSVKALSHDAASSHLDENTHDLDGRNPSFALSLRSCDNIKVLLDSKSTSVYVRRSLKALSDGKCVHHAVSHADENTHDLDAQKASFALCVRTCGSTQTLSDGKSIHQCILQSGLSHDVFLANLLLQMYSKCSALLDSLSLFSHMPVRDQYSWNFMIRALDQNNQSQEAVLLYDNMLREGCLPDKHIYASILSGCASTKDRACGIQMHARVVGYGIESDGVVGGNLVSMYGKCGHITDASYIFYNLDERSAMSWTVLIAAYAEHGNNEDIVQLFEEMQQDGTPLDRVTFISILSACAGRAALSEGKRIHEFVLKSGFSTELTVANSLVNMYGKCRSVKDAWEVFAGLHERDLVSWSAMIAAFAESEQGMDAWDAFCRMHQEGFAPNRITLINILCACADEELLRAGKQLHAMIACQDINVDVFVSTAVMNMYRNCGDLCNALMVYRDLPIRDEGANVSILSVCANYGAMVDGKEAHAYITRCGVDSENNVCIALVNMYGKCGNLEEARRTFDLACRQDVILWNAMAATYAQNGQGLEVLGLFRQMQEEKVQANKATYSTLLTAFSHAGLVEEAYGCFILMDQESKMKPMADQYNCMADLLARTGRLDEATEVVNSMPRKPTSASWLTLLSICRTQVDVKLGECTAKHVMELDPEETGSYVILANIYCHEQGE